MLLSNCPSVLRQHAAPLRDNEVIFTHCQFGPLETLLCNFVLPFLALPCLPLGPDVVELLDSLQRHSVWGTRFTRTPLCQTVAQNVCDILHLVDDGPLPLDQREGMH